MHLKKKLSGEIEDLPRNPPLRAWCSTSIARAINDICGVWYDYTTYPETQVLMFYWPIVDVGLDSVLHGMAWYDTSWYGVVWYGMVRHLLGGMVPETFCCFSWRPGFLIPFTPPACLALLPAPATCWMVVIGLFFCYRKLSCEEETCLSSGDGTRHTTYVILGSSDGCNMRRPRTLLPVFRCPCFLFAFL